MSTLKQEHFILSDIDVKIKSPVAVVHQSFNGNEEPEPDHDWKLSPNVQTKIILHKLKLRQVFNRGKDCQRESNETTQSVSMSESEPCEKPAMIKLSDDSNNSNQFLEKLKNIILQCEEECSHCCKFITQISEHIQNGHYKHDIPPGNVQQNHMANFCLQTYTDANIDIKYECDSFDQVVIPTTPTITTENVSNQADFLTFHAVIPKEEDSSAGTSTWNEVFNISQHVKCEENENDDEEGPLYNPDENGGVDQYCDTDDNFDQEMDLVVDTGDTLELNDQSSSVVLQNPEIPKPKPKPYFCLRCNVGFSDITLLIEHNSRVHDDEVPRGRIEKPHKCGICGQHFRVPSTLANHLRIHKDTEDDLRPCKCKICGKRFTTKSGLENHKSTHNGPKPFGCEFCKKRYRQKKNLINHLKSKKCVNATV